MQVAILCQLIRLKLTDASVQKMTSTVQASTIINNPFQGHPMSDIDVLNTLDLEYPGPHSRRGRP